MAYIKCHKIALTCRIWHQSKFDVNKSSEVVKTFGPMVKRRIDPSSWDVNVLTLPCECWKYKKTLFAFVGLFLEIAAFW